MSISIDINAAVELVANYDALVDDTTFNTVQTSVAYNASGMSIVWVFVSTAGVVTVTSVTPTTGGGNYDWAHKAGGIYSLKMPASGGASINNNAAGYGYFRGKATGVAGWVSPIYVFRASGLNDALVDNAWSTTRGLAGDALPNTAYGNAGDIADVTRWGGTVVGSANVRADLRQMLGTALTEGAAGRLAAALITFLDVASPVFTAASVNQSANNNTILANGSYGNAALKVLIDAVQAIVGSGTHGNAALLAAIQNVQNNTFIATSIPMTLERPDAGSVTVNISIVFADETGTAKNLDSGNPIITLVDDAGNSLTSRLGSWTNPATGKYVVPYTSSSTDDLEGMHWDVSGTINSKLRRLPAYTQIVDTTAADFTTADRTKLEDIFNKLPAGDIAAEATSQEILEDTGTTLPAAIPSAGANADAVRTELTTELQTLQKLDTTLEVDGADYRFTAGALAEAPSGGGGGGATPSQIADALWDEILGEHTVPGSAAVQLQAAGASGDPWAIFVPGDYEEGTAGKKLGDLPQNISLVVPTAVANASQTPGLIAALRGDTLRKTLPTLGDITGHTKCVFTLKKRESDPDSAAVLSIDEDGGLLWLNGAEAPDASKASLTIADEADAEPLLYVDESIMATMPIASGWLWDVQVWNGSDVVSLGPGQWSVSPDVTRAV